MIEDRHPEGGVAMHDQRRCDPSGPAAPARVSARSFGIWDGESRNLLGSHETVTEALSIIRELVEANGSDYGKALAILMEDLDGNSRLIATGEALRSLLALERMD
jgi:hypothetical protein